MTEPSILLVDDEVPLVETLTRRLKKRGINIFSAFSGEAGLQALQEHPEVDVVILDVKMPGMDGIEALAQIKKMAPLVEVIMLTGHATVETGIQGMQRGAYDYLMKPCNIEELVTKVQRAVDKKQAHEARIADRGRFMEASTLEELMVPLEDYATVSENANILEAIFALETAQESFQPGRYRHRAVLVLSASGRVVGKLSQHDIIKSLEPQYHKEVKGQHSALGSFGFSRDFIESVTLQYNDWDRPLQNLYKKAIDQKVSTFMHKPTDGEFIDESATINETIHSLIVGEHHSLLVTKGEEIVGIVRLTDVFDLIHLRLKTLHLAAQIGSSKDAPPES